MNSCSENTHQLHQGLRGSKAGKKHRDNVVLSYDGAKIHLCLSKYETRCSATTSKDLLSSSLKVYDCMIYTTYSTYRNQHCKSG